MNAPIIDHGRDDPLPFENDPLLVALARHGVEAIRQRGAREAFEQAERDYLAHNRTLDGQS